MEQRSRSNLAAERGVVAHVGPQSAGGTLVLREHWHRRVVGVDAFSGQHVLFDFLDQRRKRCRARTNPIGQRRDVEVDAFLRVDVALAIERKVGAVLGKQNVRQ